MHRVIMNSAAYRMSSIPTASALAKDAPNELLSRFRLRRLEAEELRDAMLATAGTLSDAKGGPGVRPPMPLLCRQLLASAKGAASSAVRCARADRAAAAGATGQKGGAQSWTRQPETAGDAGPRTGDDAAASVENQGQRTSRARGRSHHQPGRRSGQSRALLDWRSPVRAASIGCSDWSGESDSHRCLGRRRWKVWRLRRAGHGPRCTVQ